jgi:predicted HTH domain antitoxin
MHGKTQAQEEPCLPMGRREARVIAMKLEIEVPDSSLSALRQAPKEFTACLRLMAAAKLYEVGDLSQERAAELAGQSRQAFLASLSRLGVSPFQGVEEDFEFVDSCP